MADLSARQDPSRRPTRPHPSQLAPGPAGTWSYVRAAVGVKWNLLLVLGGAAAALLTPWPDIALPLLGAAELAYVAGLTSLPRFRAAIDARVWAQQQAGEALQQSGASGARLEELLAGLDPTRRRRFETLRQRCLEMRDLAQGVAGRTGRSTFDEVGTPALDQMLWVFLRLLCSQQALDKFLSATSEDAIRTALAASQQKLETAQQGGNERLVKSLQASIASGELRLDNHRKAGGNAEFVAAELDRVESQAQALIEMSVSHQDPDYISNQVSVAAKDLGNMEKTLQELNAITGLTDQLEAPPPILAREVVRQ